MASRPRAADVDVVTAGREVVAAVITLGNIVTAGGVYPALCLYTGDAVL
jgi:hypothetical protein